MENKSYQEVLQNFNYDNYRGFCEVETKEELIQEMKQHYTSYYEGEKLEKVVRDKIEWVGSGEYCIYGCALGLDEEIIMNTRIIR